MKKNIPHNTELARCICVNEKDNVAVILADINEGERIFNGAQSFASLDHIPEGHKVALCDIKAGEHIVKYGAPIGVTTCGIKKGQHVHSHNLKTTLIANNPYSYNPDVILKQNNKVQDVKNTFMGFNRQNGKVGTRNEVWVLNTVGCVNKISENIAKSANLIIKGNPEYENIDGAYSFSHQYGCSQLGDDLKHTRNIISCLAQHPNAGSILIVGLGCENNQLNKLLEGLDHIDSSRIRSFNAQSVEDESEVGEQAINELLELMKKDRRTECSVAHLSLGMNCGGSDAFSGMSANPLVGKITDIITEQGGSSLLTEVPEMFGAEQILMNRAANNSEYSKIKKLINDFKDYFIKHEQPIYENPSPGNIKGGITTLEEKSLGAVQKSGDAIITNVLPYAEINSKPGLTLISGPGNDAVSATALIAGGATLILFTTGRGTPLGFPVPTIKISSNSDLAIRKPKWIDFDAGRCLSNEKNSTELCIELWDLIIDSASGKKTRNEINECREIAIWKQGVTL
ncbi:MAG: altronate hydrolase [Alphaproteobacteria bacterium]|nr:MAG: altronate hydrolase [Alphaproteobacteria bacterium]